ncbi:GPN-loop GTPase 3, partial [Bonamia ostreae]
MGKHGQLIMGPAGVGKSTYCKIMSEHFEVSKRKVNVVNLDPAAEKFDYPLLADIRDLISVDDASELLKLGPNGSLVFCMEYLVENIDWLLDSIGNYEDDYILFDCPGQIELYSHYPVMRQIIDQIKN